MRSMLLACMARLLAVGCCLALSGAGPVALSQIAEPAEPAPDAHQHMHMGAHFMNFPMGEETCAPQYTYTAGSLGPEHWLGVCRTGAMQSPIDIRNAEKLPLGTLLKFNYRPVPLDVINDCNRYRLLVRFPENDWLRIGKKPYFLSEVHFRQPGENAVDGKRPRMSVELVHLDPETTIAIIEVPVVAGKENPAMKALLEHVPAPGKEGKVPQVQIDANDLLPRNRSFYRVPGSLTLPICNEGVTWYVMKHPIELSEAQIAAYGKLYHDTARPLQPANGRPVADSGPVADSD
jgi:carbonic anhydrase